MLNDVKRPAFNIYVFGAFWDFRKRPFAIRHGYYIAGPPSPKVNLNVTGLQPKSMELIEIMKAEYNRLKAQGLSRVVIESRMKANFTELIIEDNRKYVKLNATTLKEQYAETFELLKKEGWSLEQIKTHIVNKIIESKLKPNMSTGLLFTVRNTSDHLNKKHIENIGNKTYEFEKLEMLETSRRMDASAHLPEPLEGGRGRNPKAKRGRKKYKKKLKQNMATPADLYVRVYIAADRRMLMAGVMRDNTTVDYRVGGCEFYYPDGKIQEGSYFIQSQSMEIYKNGKTLIGGYAMCHLCCMDHNSDYPEGVALIPKNFKGDKQIMYIRGNKHVLKSKNAKKEPLALCVRPFFGSLNYQKVSNFLLYYSSVGVSHFVFQNTGVATPRMNLLLKVAKASNISLEFRSWKMQDKLAYEFLQNMNIEICLHSLMGHFVFVGVVDIDELIVPKKGFMNIPSLLNYLIRPNQENSLVKVFMFKSAFFCDESYKYPTNAHALYSGDDSLQILRDVVRSSYIHDVRHKYIVRPEEVYEAHIHGVYLHARTLLKQQTRSTLFVNLSLAAIHHYRNIEINMTDLTIDRNCTIVDTTIRKFGQILKSNAFFDALYELDFLSSGQQSYVRPGPNLGFKMSLPGSGNLIVAFKEPAWSKRQEELV